MRQLIVILKFFPFYFSFLFIFFSFLFFLSFPFYFLFYFLFFPFISFLLLLDESFNVGIVCCLLLLTVCHYCLFSLFFQFLVQLNHFVKVFALILVQLIHHQFQQSQVANHSYIYIYIYIYI